MDVTALADPVRTVRRLVLDRRVPPAVVVDHVARRGEVQPGASGLEREHQHRHGAFGRLELRDELITPGSGHAAVEEPHTASEMLDEVALQHLPHLRELGEHERPLSGLAHLLEDLEHPLELARASGER